MIKINQWDKTVFIDKTDISILWLDYVNNFLTVDRFAEYYGLTVDSANKIIKLGQNIQRG